MTKPGSGGELELPLQGNPTHLLSLLKEANVHGLLNEMSPVAVVGGFSNLQIIGSPFPVCTTYIAYCGYNWDLRVP